jgi:hypothetical protein
MITDTKELADFCAIAGIDAGRQIRRTVYEMALIDRAAPTTSQLKPRNVAADAAAEAVAIECLEQLGRTAGYRIELITDVQARVTYTLGSSPRAEVIFCYLDAIDGTVKVAGLGNDLPNKRVRAACDGAWATAMAFTAPTTKTIDELALGDFAAAAITEGNPTVHTNYPQEVMAVPGRNGPETYDVTAGARRRVFTSTNTKLNQAMVFLDAFQAYDLDTRRDGDDVLVVELYRLLTNRHAGGAYDVLRQFGTLSALLRLMLGWRDPSAWYESQGAAFVIVNENLANLIPALAIIEGAGGISIDFDDRLLRHRRLSEGRTSVVHAANQNVREQIVKIVEKAKARAAKG